MHRNLSIVALIFYLYAAVGASAAPAECEFDSWRGGTTEDIVISWIGLGFTADASSGVVQIRVPGGYYEAQQAKIVRNERFTGFVYYTNERASDGSLYRHRYSFRIYRTGKCEARVDENGFVPLIATGRVKS